MRTLSSEENGIANEIIIFKGWFHAPDETSKM